MKINLWVGVACAMAVSGSHAAAGPLGGMDWQGRETVLVTDMVQKGNLMPGPGKPPVLETAFSVIVVGKECTKSENFTAQRYVSAAGSQFVQIVRKAKDDCEGEVGSRFVTITSNEFKEVTAVALGFPAKEQLQNTIIVMNPELVLKDNGLQDAQPVDPPNPKKYQAGKNGRGIETMDLIRATQAMRTIFGAYPLKQIVETELWVRVPSNGCTTGDQLELSRAANNSQEQVLTVSRVKADTCPEREATTSIVRLRTNALLEVVQHVTQNGTHVHNAIKMNNPRLVESQVSH